MHFVIKQFAIVLVEDHIKPLFYLSNMTLALQRYPIENFNHPSKESDIVARITGALIPQKPSVFPILRNHLRALFPLDYAMVNHTYRVHARARN